MRFRHFILFSLAFLFVRPLDIFSQNYRIIYDFKPDECTRGAAGVNVEGLQTNDTLQIIWSNGKTNVLSISDLEAGDYSAQVIIKNKKDTTINFKIEKEPCLVVVSNHFTPNDDGYNDGWTIFNTEYYPEFNLFVFDKWGQQVHKQSGTYSKWNGTLGSSNIAVADGTYYYVFYYKGTSGKHIKGDVTILR